MARPGRGLGRDRERSQEARRSPWKGGPMTWNPDQYERFREERSQPFFDLLDLCEPRPAMRVIDLGCGTGELTAKLHSRLAAAETVGIDSSAAMLEKSRAHNTKGLRFELGD